MHAEASDKNTGVGLNNIEGVRSEFRIVILWQPIRLFAGDDAGPASNTFRGINKNRFAHWVFKRPFPPQADRKTVRPSARRLFCQHAMCR